jgi:hypothetical protein
MSRCGSGVDSFELSVELSVGEEGALAPEDSSQWGSKEVKGLERSAGLSTVEVDGPESSTGLSSEDRLQRGLEGECGSRDAKGVDGLAVSGEGDGKCKGSFERVWPEGKTVFTEVLKSKISLSSSHHLGQE